MKPLLYLRTLGHFELLRVDRNEAVPVPTGKSRALLIYLALTPHEVRRERLADLFWPDLPVEAGRFNLRHALFHLRRLCNPACGETDLFLHDRDHVSLTPGVLEVDVSMLLAPDARHDEAMLCQDDFVADLHLPGCDEFEEWLLSIHERIQLAQVGMLDALSSNCEARGDMDTAIVHARRLTEITPYSDEARQRLMRLLTAAGRRQSAMLELECFSSLLMRDLGVHPKAETVRLARETGIEMPVHALPPARAERRMARRREWRSATVLYCELANSLGADTTQSCMTEAEKLFATVMAKYQGTVLRSLRWGMLAYFGYPLARGDAPDSAVRAALAASRAFGAAKMPVRCGLHLGLMVCDAHFPDLTGELAEIAHRLCLVAEPGEVVISGEVQGALGGHFVTTSLGMQHFRGLKRSLQAVCVTAFMTDREGRNAPPQLFGREREISFLENALTRAQAGGNLRISVYGAAGMGKSALMNALAAEARLRGMRVMKLRFLPECRYNPYYPVSFDLVEYFEPDHDIAEPLPHQAQATDSGQDAFAALFSLAANECAHGDPSSTMHHKRLLAGLTGLMRKLCEQQAVLLIAENMHQADAFSSELLAHLASGVPSHLMTLSTSLEQPVSGAGREGESIHLGRLDEKSAMDLVRSVVKTEIDDALMAQIADLAAGVPFFLVEMARSHCDGATPSCIQTLLQVRMDRLGQGKRVAQMASVLGLRVEPGYLAMLCGLPPEALEELLRSLFATAILQWNEDGSLAFRSAFLRNAVYTSLMEEDRRRIHRRVAQLLSDEAADPTLLAHHFEMAHEWGLAARCWLNAGDHQAQLDASEKAVGYFAAGVAAAGNIPEGAARDELLLLLHLRQIVPLMGMHGYGSPQAGMAIAAARDWGSVELDAGSAFDLAWAEWLYASSRTACPEVLRLGQKLVRLAKESGDTGLLDHAHYAQGVSEFWLGRFEDARRRLAQIASPPMPDAQKTALARFGENIWVNATALQAWINWFGARTAQAGKLIGEAVEHAALLGSCRPHAYALLQQAAIGHFARDIAQVTEASEKLATAAATHGRAVLQLLADAMKGWARAASGDMAGVDAMVGSAAEAAQAMPSAASIFYMMAAEALLFSGRTGEAGIQLARARAVMEQFGEAYLMAELERLDGCCCWLAGQHEQALRHARQAVAIARAQGARALVMRAQDLLQYINGGEEPGLAALVKLVHVPFPQLASAIQMKT